MPGAGSRFDYATVGHVTVDVLEDGSRRPGGTAFYSALQASRLGLRTLVLTRGDPTEIEALLGPYLDELALHVLPAPNTTTLATNGIGDERRQRLLAWAGEIDADAAPDAGILHLAPVARELAPRGSWEAPFVGLTAQGLVREWLHEGGEVSLRAPSAEAAAELRRLGETCDAIVLSELERSACAELIEAAAAADTAVAVTDGPAPSTVLRPGASALRLPVPPLEYGEPVEDLGAGDVFAAAFFVALAEGAAADAAARLGNAAAAERMAGAGPGAVGDRAAIERRATALAGREPRDQR
jgi:sugar/nucleoside kinase (ribokinase family)